MALRRRGTQDSAGVAAQSATPALSPFPLAQRVDEPLLLWLIVGFFFCAAAGAVLLHFSANPSGNPMPLDRAVFASINAITLTGFELAPTAMRDLQPAGQMVVFALTLTGTLFALMAGTSLVSSLLGLGNSRRRIITFAIAVTGVMTALGSGFLMLRGQSVFPTVFSAAAAFGNSGANIQGPWGLMDPQLHIVLLPLAALGAMGMPLLMEFWAMLAGTSRLSEYGQRVLRLSAIAYLAGLAGLLILQAGSMESAKEAMASSSTLSLDSRSLGLMFSPLPWTRAGQWFVLVLMLIGGTPAGTNGGMRLTTLGILLDGTRKLLRGQTPPRELGFALYWTGMFLAMAFLTMLMLLASEPRLPGDRVAFLAASAIGNVGLSHDPISMTGVSLYIASMAMLAGRLAPVGFAWWLARKGGSWDTPIC